MKKRREDILEEKVRRLEEEKRQLERRNAMLSAELQQTKIALAVPTHNIHRQKHPQYSQAQPYSQSQSPSRLQSHSQTSSQTQTQSQSQQRQYYTLSGRDT
jgi:hypothetical protein